MTIDRLFSIAATAILSAAFISVMAAPAAAADCTAANTGALFCWETKLPIDPRAIAALEGVPALDRNEVWACAPDRDGGVRCAPPRARDGSDAALRASDPRLLGVYIPISVMRIRAGNPSAASDGVPRMIIVICFAP